MRSLVTRLALLLLWGCGSPSADFLAPPAAVPNPSSLVSRQSLEVVTPSQLVASDLEACSLLGGFLDRHDGLGDDPAEGRLLDSIWERFLRFLSSYLRHSVHSYKLTYTSRDALGRAQTLTGLLVLPQGLGQRLSAPILSLQHPTQTLRKYSPSARRLDDDELQYQSALLFASAGYVVVAADYAGAGDNYDPHPYTHASLAHSVVDLIQVAQQPAALGPELGWNGQVYLMGYSEGGYATLVAARELQQRGTPPQGVASLDGPLSLSESMRQVILTSDAQFSAPYFVPLIVGGYAPIYQSQRPIFEPEQALIPNPAGYVPPAGSSFARELLALTTGQNTPAEINALMRQAQPYTGPASVLSSAFRSQLQNPTSSVVETLAENDAYRGWRPFFPLKMFHNVFDDLVPHSNTQRAAVAFLAQPNVETDYFLEFLPGLGSIHAGAMPVATVLGFQWIDRRAFPNR